MAYNTYGAPYLSTYAEAKAWHDKTIPIRGKTVRPIGTRKYHEFGNIEIDGDNVVLNYERAPLVIWRPDDSFTLNAPFYYNAFQAEKMMGWVPRGMGFEWDKGRMFVRTNSGCYPLPRRGSLEFKRDGEDSQHRPRYVVVDVAVPKEYKMIRNSREKLVRQHCEPFLAWVSVVLNNEERLAYGVTDEAQTAFLTELGYSPKQIEAQRKAVEPLEYSNAYRQQVYSFTNALSKLPFRSDADWFSRRACEIMFSRVSGEDATHWPQMLMVIRKQAGRYVWGGRGSGYITTYENVFEYLKDLVAYLNRDKCFVVERLEPGQIPSKRNARFFTDLVHVF